jgi:hypothetical protein
MIHSRYLIVVALGVALWFVLFVAFTLFIDAYGVSPLRVTVRGVNEFKPKRVDIDRIIKPYEVWRLQPKTVFLGTSRIHQSIDPAVLDRTKYAPAYNASIPASSLGLNISHLQQYLKLDPSLRTVVVELFLYNFLGQGQEHPPKDFNEYLRNSLNLFISSDAFWASLQTLYYNLKVATPVYEIKPGGYFYYPPRHNAKGHFDGYPAGIWKLHATRPTGMKLHQPAFDAVREIIELCRAHKLELIFVLTPNHAYDDYYIEAIGGWDTVQEWLARLSAEPVTLYSFSQPNTWVYESVSTQMRYWNDPYHFSLEMGRGIQQSLAGNPGGDLPQNFALRLTPDKVAAHIEVRRSAVREWAQTHPEFVAAFYEEKRKFEYLKAFGRGDPVVVSLTVVGELQKQLTKLHPGAAIKEYRVVSDELAATEAIPAYLVKDGRIENPWRGRLVAQIFPANAWEPGVPATYNYLFEGVPKQDCSRLVEALARDEKGKVFRINLEPSGKVHRRFPVSGADGCVAGSNTVGFTALAD